MPDVDESRPAGAGVPAPAPAAGEPAVTSGFPHLDPGRRSSGRGERSAAASSSAPVRPLVPMQPVRRAARREDERPRSAYRRRLLITAVAAVGVGGVAVQGLRTMTGDEPAGSMVDGPAQPHGALPASVPAGTPAPAAAQLPVRLELPRLGLTATLLHLGLAADGALAVPTDPGRLGWFRSGTVPGRRGGPPALIVGRAGSDGPDGDPAALARIRDLKQHDDILITRTDGRTLVFRIYKTSPFPARTFPDRALFAPRPDAELRLVACTGDLGRSRTTFAGCSVVFASLAGDR